MTKQKSEIDIRYPGEWTAELSTILFDFIEKVHAAEKESIQLSLSELKLDEGTLTKLSSLSTGFEREGRLYRFPIFSAFILDEESLTIEVSRHFSYWYELLVSEEQMSPFYLENYLKIGSKYAKAFFREIAHFQQQGEGDWKPELSELYRSLQIPAGYNSARLNQRVFNQLQKELVAKDKILSKLEIIPIKGGFNNLQVQRYEFHFKFNDKKK